MSIPAGYYPSNGNMISLGEQIFSIKSCIKASLLGHKPALTDFKGTWK